MRVSKTLVHFHALHLYCIVLYGEKKQLTHEYKNALTDDPDAVRGARRDSTCSFYQPPPPTDIERMRSNMIKEKKVFALIREILSRKHTLIHNNI